MAQLGHVHELHGLGLAVQLGLDPLCLVRVYGHQNRLVGGHGVADERHRPGEKLLLATVEERLVPKGGRVGWRLIFHRQRHLAGAGPRETQFRLGYPLRRRS